MIARAVQFAHDFLPIRPDLFDCIHDQAGGRKRECAIGFGSFAVVLLLVLLEEELATGKFFRWRAFAEGERTFGERPQPFNECIGYDA